MKINLGSCDNLLDRPWLNVDAFDFARPGYDFRQADLAHPWPWEDSTVSELRAHDIAEHISHPTGKRWFWNEAHRVLRPGGVLSLIVPTTDGRGAWQDPTHVTWWTPNDLFYVCDHWAEWKRFHRAYGIAARFCVLDNRSSSDVFPGRCQGPGHAMDVVNAGHTAAANSVMKLHVLLEAIK